MTSLSAESPRQRQMATITIDLDQLGFSTNWPLIVHLGGRGLMALRTSLVHAPDVDVVC